MFQFPRTVVDRSRLRREHRQNSDGTPLVFDAQIDVNNMFYICDYIYHYLFECVHIKTKS
jgi:hypothetical protein